MNGESAGRKMGVGGDGQSRDGSAGTPGTQAGVPWNSLRVLGVGVGFREAFRAELFRYRDEVDFVEVTLDHYLDAPSWKMRELEMLRDHFTVIPHGLHLSVGSADGLDEAYLEKVAALLERLSPPWWSEHIAFTRAAGIDLGHLAPLPFSGETLEVLERNVRQVKSRIPVPLILENITYHVTMPGAEMEEADFLRQVLERTDCGLLLDVTNLFVNSANHGYDALRFLDSLPAERVVQLHFAGGVEGGAEGVLVDTHSAPPPEEVWKLLEEVFRRFGVRGVILERDENLPSFSEILEELERARGAGRKAGLWA